MLIVGRIKIKKSGPGVSPTPALHYPEGVHSVENPDQLSQTTTIRPKKSIKI